jgi:TPR repeat protein
VNQDFHLAKRYYDLAAEIDPKARTPRDIALTMMEVSEGALVR